MRKSELHLDAVATNAFRFLERAARELTKDTEMSVVHFAIGVELFLKARLIAEHWALVVERSDQCRLSHLRSGQAKTIGLDETRRKLEGITETTELGVKKPLWKAIREVADHRNRIVHSHRTPAAMTKEGINKTAIEQIRAWRGLQSLAGGTWQDVFAKHMERIGDLDSEFEKHKARYALVFEDWQKSKPKGIFTSCMYCRFDALQEEEETIPSIIHRRCHVCAIDEKLVQAICPRCKKPMEVRQDGGYCPDEEDCGEELTLADAIDQLGFDEWDGGGFENGVRCGECYSLDNHVYRKDDAVVCVGCMTICDLGDVSRCDWCNEGWTYFNDEGSFAFGCELCDGRSGRRDD